MFRLVASVVVVALIALAWFLFGDRASMSFNTGVSEPVSTEPVQATPAAPILQPFSVPQQ
jgi:hypothetical protein